MWGWVSREVEVMLSRVECPRGVVRRAPSVRRLGLAGLSLFCAAPVNCTRARRCLPAFVYSPATSVDLPGKPSDP